MFPAFPSLPSNPQWEELLTHDPLQKSLISKVYNEILSFDCSPVSKAKTVWEQELGLHLGDDWWDTALKKIYTTSACARLTLIQFKVLFRVHYSKTRLSQIYPSTRDNCDKCHASPCNLTHMFYSCSVLSRFWQNYFDTMSKILSVTIKVSPHVAIFGLPEDHSRFTSNQLDILAFTSLLARRHLLLHWRSTKAPSSTQWLNDTMSFLKLEKIRYSLKGNSDKFYKKWLSFLTFFRSLQSIPPD